MLIRLPLWPSIVVHHRRWLDFVSSRVTGSATTPASIAASSPYFAAISANVSPATSSSLAKRLPALRRLMIRMRLPPLTLERVKQHKGRHLRKSGPKVCK